MQVCAKLAQKYAFVMSRSDRLKEKITWLKVLSGAFLALDTSIIAWLVRNYEATVRVIIVGACILAAAITCFVVAILVRVYCCIRSMEDL
jgi:uncharacterized membrane protein YhfC